MLSGGQQPITMKMPGPQTTPAAKLVAVTDEARSSIGNKPEIAVTAFPFRVGRESRLRPLDRIRGEIERRLNRSSPLNDLYLFEPPAMFLHISRAHFAIEQADGRFVFVDRESACGAVVAGRQVGGGRTQASAELHDGDEIIVGAAHSPYKFRFQVLSTASE